MADNSDALASNCKQIFTMGASPYHCQFVDEELCIVIRTAEGARDDTRSRRQCVRQLSSMLCYSDAPTESRIRFEMLKEKQGPVIKLYVSREVLPQLPLLADIGSCTQTDPDSVNTTEGVSRDGNVTPACSAWGLVSLVLLMEGEVEVEEWFGSPDGDPALPAATLEAADFLGCDAPDSSSSPCPMLRNKVGGLRSWLLHTLKDVAEQHECLNSNSALTHMSEMFKRAEKKDGVFTLQHHTNVLDMLPLSEQEGVVAAWAKETPDVSKWVFLPPRFLKVWLAAYGPIFDLSSAALSEPSVAALLMSMQGLHVSSLHLSAESYTSFQGDHNSLRIMAISMPNMRGLTQLGLHGFVLPPQSLPMLAQLFLPLSTSLTHLTIGSITEGAHNQAGYSPDDRVKFFECVALLKSLKVLAMGNCYQFLKPHPVAVQPLRSLPLLEAIHVPTNRGRFFSNTLSMGLPFKEVESFGHIDE